MNVHISEKDCIGCGVCAGICADTFEMGDDQLAHVATSQPDGDHEECAKVAATDCPTHAIILN